MRALLAVLLAVGSDRVPLPWAVCARYVRPGARLVQVRFDSYWLTREEACARAREGACYLRGDGTADEECPAGSNTDPTVEHTQDAAYCRPLPPLADQNSQGRRTAGPSHRGAGVRVFRRFTLVC